MAQFGVYFNTIFSSENSRNLYSLHRNAIIAKPSLRSPGKKNRWCNLEYILLKLALYNVNVVRFNLLGFGVNIAKIFLKKNI